MESRIELNKDDDFSGNISNSEISNLEESFTGQEILYGTITPAPTKHHVNPLPALKESLVLPKQRSRSANWSDKSKSPYSTNPKVLKRPSTCGKEGIRNFSTPLPLKVRSLLDTEIPTLSPETSMNEDTANSTFDSNISLDTCFEETPLMTKRLTSPVSVRSFSSPLAELRSKSNTKSNVQICLSQSLSTELSEESERDLQLEITKLQHEVNIMKKVKRYRMSEESKSLDRLIDKWRNIAEMASNYIYNQAASKVSRMGGMSEFRKRQKKSKLRKMKFEFDESVLYRLEEYMETEEYKNLDKYDQEELISKKKELKKMSERIENGEFESSGSDTEDEEGNELTMKDLYKQLGLDYDLVYDCN